LPASGPICRVARVFYVEDANVVGTRYDGTVVRVGHKLHGEDVRSVACYDRGSKAELLRVRTRIVCVNVDTVVIGARGKEAARS
jgi:hypothetical protein